MQPQQHPAQANQLMRKYLEESGRAGSLMESDNPRTMIQTTDRLLAVANERLASMLPEDPEELERLKTTCRQYGPKFNQKPVANLLQYVNADIWGDMVQAQVDFWAKTVSIVQPNGNWVLIEYSLDFLTVHHMREVKDGVDMMTKLQKWKKVATEITYIAIVALFADEKNANEVLYENARVASEVREENADVRHREMIDAMAEKDARLESLIEVLATNLGGDGDSAALIASQSSVISDQKLAIANLGSRLDQLMEMIDGIPALSGQPAIEEPTPKRARRPRKKAQAIQPDVEPGEPGAAA